MKLNPGVIVVFDNDDDDVNDKGGGGWVKSGRFIFLNDVSTTATEGVGVVDLSHAVQLSILFLNLSDGFKVSSLNTIDAAAAAVDVATAGVASSPIDLLILLLLLVFISESESKSFSKSKIYF